MRPSFKRSALAVLLASGVVAGAQAEQTASQWIGRVGLWGVLPDSDNFKSAAVGTIDVDDSYRPGFNITYKPTPELGIEVIGAWPFKHDIELNGKKVGDTYQLPPTVFLQYHFTPQSSIRPYAGVGLNYTFFWDEETTGALKGSKLDLDSSWGLAGELGVDIDLTPDLFLNGVVSYMDIDTKATLNGGKLGTVQIDPWVFGVMVGTRF